MPGPRRPHPIALETRYELAVRGTDIGALAPILDRTPLEHGRPALGEGHPLLVAARSGSEPEPEGEDLSWDVSEDH